jgi:hypothetical protein
MKWLWEPKRRNTFQIGRIMNSSTKCKHRPVYEIENKLNPVWFK